MMRVYLSISIHSPRMGRDAASSKVTPLPRNFNPLSPHGERHGAPERGALHHLISIHSPRMGRDLDILRQHHGGRNFNPLSPHGERRLALVMEDLVKLFQSTLPAWGETSSAV